MTQTHVQPLPESGLTQVRKRLRGLRANVWRATEATMSRRYKSWDLPYDTRHHPEELEVLTRPQLQRSDVIGLEGGLDWTGVDPIWMDWIWVLKDLEWTGLIRCRLLELQ